MLKSWKTAAVFALAGILGETAYAQQTADEKAQDKKLYQDAANGVKTALPQLKTRAELGDALAQFYMGMIYDAGSGVAKDYVEAVKWLRMAAERGDAFAQGLVGEHYAGGDGVPKDLVVAYMWLNISAANGDRASAILREHIEKSMTPEQIAEAQRLSREWKPAR